MPARILVVDDILPNVKLLEAKLTSEYYDVITALNGEDALRKAREDTPDLILLDVMMPGMDGFEVCRRLKEDSQTDHIPVVMVTALSLTPSCDAVFSRARHSSEAIFKRTSERTRAINAVSFTGLLKKSSAPFSRPRTRSCVSDKAVTITTGM